FFSSRRRHTRSKRDWSSDVCSSDLAELFFKAGFHGLKSGFKIDVVGDFLDELLVGDDAVGADDEHGAAEEAEFLDGDAIGRTEEIGRASCRERADSEGAGEEVEERE